jgi:hypothetical protein
VIERIGRYRVEGQLGAGGFATVLLAVDPVLDTTVAVKVLAHHFAEQPDVRARFVHEARVLRSIRSDRLVRVYDVGELDDGRPYFVMEHVSRGTVADRLAHLRANGWTPSPAELHRFVGELGATLAVVHEAGVVHRDVKPSNVLVLAGDGAGPPPDRLLGDAEVLVLGDFGMAKVLGADTRQLTIAGGTMGYMAPEQYRPGASVDARADLYAATAVVLEVLAGEPPPVGIGFAPDAVDAVLSAAPGPPSLHAALRTGLAPEPDDRFPSSAAWTAAFQAAFAPPASDSADVPVDPPAAAPAAARPGPPAEAPGRPRWWYAAAGTLVAALIVVLVLWLRDEAAAGRSIVGPGRLVVGDEGAYVADVAPGVNWAWVGPNGERQEGGDLRIRPTSPGRLTVRLTTPDGATDLRVEVVAADPDVGIDGPALLVVGQAETYRARVPAGSTVVWIAGDGERYEQAELTVRPDTPGVLTIRLEATTPDGTRPVTRAVTVVEP